MHTSTRVSTKTHTHTHPSRQQARRLHCGHPSNNEGLGKSSIDVVAPPASVSRSVTRSQGTWQSSPLTTSERGKWRGSSPHRTRSEHAAGPGTLARQEAGAVARIMTSHIRREWYRNRAHQRRGLKHEAPCGGATVDTRATHTTSFGRPTARCAAAPQNLPDAYHPRTRARRRLWPLPRHPPVPRARA